MLDDPIVIVGAPGSPYSQKMLGVLRYRRIPHRWVVQGSPESLTLPQPRVRLLPVLVMPGSSGELEAKVDSTPLIRELEMRHPDAARSVVPKDPALAFLDALLEDFADEWLTKAMFHYRWAYRADIDKAQRILPRWFRTNQPEESSVQAGETFGKRQIERLWVVGSNETTGPVIESSYERLLGLLDAHLTEHRFLNGARPGTADFAFYGQLTQLVGFDPTPSAVSLRVAPRVCAWVDVVSDLSGVEPASDAGDWFDPSALPATFAALLGEVGRVYAPFLISNADALTNERDRVECTIDGARWTQKPFPYQGKCLLDLRQAYSELPGDARSSVDRALAGTGCETLFS